MDATIPFGRPGPAERARIWRRHLPDAAIAEDVVERFAAEHRLTGGQIRNAVLHARMLAAARGGAPALDDLDRAVAVEHRKAGSMLPAPPRFRTQARRAVRAIGLRP
jgi:SpoVK/Ycf46/Vps4 family AAA+-type ATPase